MKKEFNNPIIEVIVLNSEDIIRTSTLVFGDPSDGTGSIGDLF